VAGEDVEDYDSLGAVVAARGLGLVVVLHEDVVLDGERHLPHPCNCKQHESVPAEVRMW
jgi:hypothetical protein